MREKVHYWEADKHDTQDFDERFGKGEGGGTILGDVTPYGMFIVTDYLGTWSTVKNYGCGKPRMGKGDYNGNGKGDG